MLYNLANYVYVNITIYSLCWILLMSCGLYLLVKIYNFAKCYSYVRWKLPGPKLDHPIWGMNITKLNGKALANMENNLKEYPRFARQTIGPISTIQITGPEVAQQVFNQVDSSKSIYFHYIFEPLLGDGLVSSKGAFWKRNRKLLTPTFHDSNVRKFVKKINKSSDRMIQVINRDRNGETPIEIVPLIKNFTLEVLLSCLCSKGSDIQLNIDSNCREMMYAEGLEKFRKGIFERTVSFTNMLNIIFHNRKVGKDSIKGCETTKHYFRSLIQERQELIREEQDSEDTDSTKSHDDMLDLLMRSRDEEGNSLTQKQIIDELNTFVLGHDATGSTSSFVFYLLAKYPKLQEKCREEVMSVMGGRDEIEWEDIAKFTYLTCFIKETLRLYPPAVFISKMVDKPLVIDGYHIPANVSLDIWIYLIHRNANHWKDPGKFDPSRFNEENIKKHHPYAFIPFSHGPRNCIGQNFGMSELNIITAKIITKFQVILQDDGYELDSIVTIALTPSDNLPLILKSL